MWSDANDNIFVAGIGMKDLVLAVVILILLVGVSLNVDFNSSTDAILLKQDNVILVADEPCITQGNMEQVSCIKVLASN